MKKSETIMIEAAKDEYYKSKVIIFPKAYSAPKKDSRDKMRYLLQKHHLNIVKTTRWIALLCLLMLAVLPRFEATVHQPSSPVIIVSPDAIYSADNNVFGHYEILGKAYIFFSDPVVEF